MSRLLHFDNDKLLFLLLNIVGHDPIHDFGRPSDQKWKSIRNVIEIIENEKKKDGIEENSVNHDDDDGEEEEYGQEGGSGNRSRFYRDKALVAEKRKISLKNERNYVTEFVEKLKCDIIYSIFELATNVEKKIEIPLYILCSLLTKNADETPESIGNLYLYIISWKLNDFILRRFKKDIHVNLEVKLSFDKELIVEINGQKEKLFIIIQSFFNTEDIHNSLFDFNNYNDIEDINDNEFKTERNVTTFQHNIHKKLKSEKGGASAKRKINEISESESESDTKPEPENLRFLTALDKIVYSEPLNKHIRNMALLLKGYTYEDIIGNTKYSNLTNVQTNSVVKNFKDWEGNPDIWNKKWMEMNKKFIEEMEDLSKEFNTILSNPLNSKEFNSKILNMKSEFYKLLKGISGIDHEDSNKTYERTFTYMIKRRAKAVIPDLQEAINRCITTAFKDFVDERKKNRSKLAKELKASYKEKIGDLSKRNSGSVKRFVSFIAKSALYLTGICDISGSMIMNSNDSALSSEIDILRAKITNEPQQNWRNGINDTGTSQDERLYNFFRDTENEVGKKKEYTDISGENVEETFYESCSNSKKCVINNAAIWKNDSFKKKSFCPYTSILDGMPSCSYNKELNGGNLEFGDMDFKICIKPEPGSNSQFFYNGKLKLKVNDKTKVNVELNLELLSKIVISAKAHDIEMTSKDLDAPHVLLDTMRSLLTKLENRDIQFRDDVFINMFNASVNIDDKDDFFQIVFGKLLLKGAGDIFQEINAVAKFGGYSKSPLYNKKTVEIFDSFGNAKRCFITNDRVSMARFLFIKKWGDVDQVNKGAFGGYIAEKKETNIGIKYDINIGNTMINNQSRKKPKRGGNNHFTENNRKKIRIFENVENVNKKNVSQKMASKKNENKRLTKKKIKIGKNITINITM